MHRLSKIWPALLVSVLALAACGDDGGGDVLDGGLPDDVQDAGDELGDGLGAGGGGGGALTFDGEEIEIASVTCVLDDETFDVGTVSDNGFRVFVSRNNPANDASAQVLDADSIQWFPQGVSGDEAQRDGGTFTSEPTTYFNNSDDSTVEVSFTIECP